MTEARNADSPLYPSATQIENGELVRQFVIAANAGGDPTIWDRYLALTARIWAESKPTDPVASQWAETTVHIGPAAMKAIADAYVNVGFTYEIVIHNIFVSGPAVIVTRTDTRKEKGQPDKHFPAVGVFAVKDGMIVEWSDYYR